MSDPSPLTRQQLAKFLPNHEAIIAFERLFKVAGNITPTNIDEVLIDSGSASAKAISVDSELQSIKNDILLSLGINESKTNISLDVLEKLSHLIDLLSTSPKKVDDNFRSFDYINFNRYSDHVHETGALDWHEEDDTLNIHHSGGVVQQVGQEIYARVKNSTGSDFADGEVIGSAGVGTDAIIEGEKYIADGSISSLYVLGIATQDIVDTAKGHVTTWGYVRDIDTTGTSYGETWLVGDILYVSPTVAGRLTNIKPTAPLLVIPMATVTFVNATTGSFFVRTTVDQPMYYGTFVDTTDQTAAIVNTPYPITFNTTGTSDGIYIGTPTSRLYFENAGFYNLKFTAQVTSSSASTKTLWFWPRVNGADVPNSSMKMSISNNGFTATISRSVSMSFNAGDYLEATWATDDITVTLEAAPSTAFAPATPSVILAIHEITQ